MSPCFIDTLPEAERQDAIDAGLCPECGEELRATGRCTEACERHQRDEAA